MAEASNSTTSPNPQPTTDSERFWWAVIPADYTGPLSEPILKRMTAAEALVWQLRHPYLALRRIP